MTPPLRSAIKAEESRLGRQLDPDEYRNFRLRHEAELEAERLRLSEDDEHYIDPMELVEDSATAVPQVVPAVGRRIKLPDASVESRPVPSVGKRAKPTVTIPSETPPVPLATSATAASVVGRRAATTGGPAEEPSEVNPVDGRLGNLSGTLRPSSSKKNWAKRSNATYRRRDINDRDLRVLTFLAKFKFSNSTQLAPVLGVKTNTAHRRLLGLQEVGLVASEQVLGAKLLWRATGKGLALVEAEDLLTDDEFTRVRPGDMETAQLGHYLAVNQVAIQLMAGQQEWFALPPLTEDEQRPWMSHFLTEYQVRSAWEAWKSSLGISEYARLADSSFKYSQRPTVENLHRDRWRQLKDVAGSYNGNGLDLGANMRVEHPEVWTLGREPLDKVAGLYHHADLIYLPRGDASSAVAFEVEVNKKTVADYKRALTSYKHNTALFDKVVWVCGSKPIAAQVQRAAQEVGIDQERFMALVPLRTFEGTVFTGKAWRL